MKKLLTLAAVLAVAVPLMAPKAEAQFQFIPYLGYDFDIGDGSLLIGVGAEFDVLQAVPLGIAIRPSAEYYFVDSPAGVDFNFFQLNTDVIADLATPLTGVGVFGGAGLAFGFFDSDVTDSSTEFGVNILGGAELLTGFVSPFVQARVTLMDGTRFGIQGGVKLNL